MPRPIRAKDIAASRAPATYAGDIDAFIGFLALERGLSVHTQLGYQSDLDQCAAHLAHAGAKDWRTAPRELIAGWLHTLADDAYSRGSMARKLTALRVFSKYLQREELRADDFTTLIAPPKLTRRLPATLSEADIGKLLAAASGGDPHALRDRAMLELFYSSGLRVSELSALMIQQVDLKEGFLRVFGKGSKERIVPVGRLACEALERYLTSARSHFVKPKKTGSALFLSERGTAISRKMLWVLVKKYAAQAGLEQKVKPHLLRHSFATHLLGGGADLRAIQEMLGHANLATTQIYTAVEAKRVLSHHAKFHPRNQQ